MTRPPVLVITNEADYAADSVITLLHEADVPVDRWNAETLERQAPAWSPHAESARYRSVWFRQYLAEPEPSKVVADLDDRLVVRDQWSTWIATVDDGRTSWMNPLWASRRAENKIVQLTTAIEVGFRVPPTLVTNDEARARSFAATHGAAVMKTLSAGYFANSDQAFMFTTELTPDNDLDDGEFRVQPLILQRRLTRTYDIRAIVVGDWVTAARARSDGPDWRLNPSIDWEPATLPHQVVDACRRLVVRLGLRYAAIDLIDDGTTLWFLEANQAGEFQFLDRPLGLGVARTIAADLAGHA